MNVESKIHLNKFKPRPYQLPLIDALENKKYKRLLCIWPRRAGKDLVAYNLVIRAALERVGVYFIIYPNYNQGRKILWDNVSNGERVLDFLPSALVESRNEQQMRIRLINGSVIQVVGSDNYDNSLVGTNPVGVVFSEYSISDPRAWNFVQPILAENDGWALFISTVRGRNHLYELYQIAINNPEKWFCTKLSVEDTSHISLTEIARMITSGEISEDLARQEFWNSFDRGIEGSYYSKYIDRMRVNGQIGMVPYEPAFKVHTAWDIGNDCTSIIFFQNVGQIVRIIDYYENSGAGNGLEHYVKIVMNKEYIYGRHIFPHDMNVTEWGGSRMTRLEKARQLGISGMIADKKDIDDGIEAVRSALSKIWIDEKQCSRLIKALENYRQEYDSKRNTYKGYPLHDQFSHACDAMRYLCITLPKTRDGLTSPSELDRRYQEATYGVNNNLPSIFRDDLPNY